MQLIPEDWNVVVVGRWNEALFTPAAIRERIFKLPPEGAIEVLVVLDEVLLPRVRHEGILVAPSSEKVVVAPETCSFDELERARAVARETINALPRTPFVAAGFNVRYRSDELPQSLAQRFSGELDKRFSDHDFAIIGRQFQRLVKFGTGRILIQVGRQPEGKVEVLLNFELRSKDPSSLEQWLSVPMSDVRDTVVKLLSAVLELKEEEYVIERNDHSGEHQPELVSRES